VRFLAVLMADTGAGSVSANSADAKLPKTAT
jgi:hypothetical protein